MHKSVEIHLPILEGRRSKRRTSSYIERVEVRTDQRCRRTLTLVTASPSITQTKYKMYVSLGSLRVHAAHNRTCPGDFPCIGVSVESRCDFIKPHRFIVAVLLPVCFGVDGKSAASRQMAFILHVDSLMVTLVTIIAYRSVCRRSCCSTVLEVFNWGTFDLVWPFGLFKAAGSFKPHQESRAE